MEGPVRNLEAEIEQLKNELAAQESKVNKYQVRNAEEASQMAEKATAGLKASVVKAQRSNARLIKEVSALVQKMTSIETLNNEYAH
ncbi:hypothetical protein BG015_009825 [Linnemannia schmuckeri]|uniref:Uncharacterized protein n=1 Tax=Linnemannia schmuckeri TaxID=64567 RepID=A0A9P5S7N1_9FUNG|nr:hypothetical protein BG015_009825 [Linnemannia schmuckeri]